MKNHLLRKINLKISRTIILNAKIDIGDIESNSFFIEIASISSPLNDSGCLLKSWFNSFVSNGAYFLLFKVCPTSALSNPKSPNCSAFLVNIFLSLKCLLIFDYFFVKLETLLILFSSWSCLILTFDSNLPLFFSFLFIIVFVATSRF